MAPQTVLGLVMELKPEMNDYELQSVVSLVYKILILNISFIKNKKNGNTETSESGASARLLGYPYRHMEGPQLFSQSLFMHVGEKTLSRNGHSPHFSHYTTFPVLAQHHNLPSHTSVGTMSCLWPKGWGRTESQLF